MKILEHIRQPGVVCFLDEVRGIRSFWFSAHNLFQEVMDNEEAVDLLDHWSSEQVEAAALPFLTDQDNWTDYEFNHEIVIAPISHS